VDGIEKLAAAQKAAQNGAGPAPLEDVEPCSLTEVEETYRRWLYLPDLGGLRVVLATIAANRLPQDPVWTLLVAPPSSGKTEIVMGCARLPDVYAAATLTEAALLSGSPKKDRAASATGGLLRQIGEYGVMLHKDFGSVLSMHHDARAQVLAALREIYDGSWTRLLGVDGGRALHWEGKAGFIAGCTPTVDRHHAVMSQMGDRFLLYRLASVERDAQIDRSLTRGGGAKMRKELARSVCGFFAGLDAEREPRTLQRTDIERLKVLALFATAVRSAVERDGYTRDIELVPDMEAPARLGNQLRGILDGLDVIGVDRHEAWPIVAKAAVDSVPSLRLKVIRSLLFREWVSTTDVEKATGYPNKTTRRTLEDLHAHGLVERQLGGKGEAHKWRLAEEPTSHLAELRTWTEKSEHPPETASDRGISRSPNTPTVRTTTFRSNPPDVARELGAPAPTTRSRSHE
jgi:hypothetical protein